MAWRDATYRAGRELEGHEAAGREARREVRRVEEVHHRAREPAARARRAAVDGTIRHHGSCGPPVWLTGRLHEGGTRSVRSPPRRAPLLATPIATPLQGSRPERPGPFIFLNYAEVSRGERSWHIPLARTRLLTHLGEIAVVGVHSLGIMWCTHLPQQRSVAAPSSSAPQSQS